MQKVTEAERLLVVAGGSGAGWTLPFIELALLRRQRSMHPNEEPWRSVESNEKQSESEFGTLRVILATRDTSSRVWFLHTLNKLLSKYSETQLPPNLGVQVYLTGKVNGTAEASKSMRAETILDDVASSSDKINIVTEEQESTLIPAKELHGRPDLPQIIAEESAHAAELGQLLSVFICGPSSMQNDVRNAVAGENLKVLAGSQSDGVYLHSEHFSWA